MTDDAWIAFGDKEPVGKRPIADLICEDLQTRKKLGIDRYGEPMTTFGGRSHQSNLEDAIEESLDQLIYLKTALEEEKWVAKKLMALYLLVGQLSDCPLHEQIRTSLEKILIQKRLLTDGRSIQ